MFYFSVVRNEIFPDYRVLSVVGTHCGPMSLNGLSVWLLFRTGEAFLSQTGLNTFYRPRSEGDNVLGSIRPFVFLWICLSELSCLNLGWRWSLPVRWFCLCGCNGGICRKSRGCGRSASNYNSVAKISNGIALKNLGNIWLVRERSLFIAEGQCKRRGQKFQCTEI